MEENSKPILNICLDDLSLSVRSRNCLRTLGINCVEDLVLLTEDELLLVKNMGKKSLREIKEAVEKNGLGLGMKRDHVLNSYTFEKNENVIRPNVIPEGFNSYFFRSSISDSPFSVRATNFFKTKGITKIYEVVNLTSKDILAEPNAGRKTVHEILSILQKYGLTLDMGLRLESEELSTHLNNESLDIPNSELISEDLNKFLAFSTVLEAHEIKKIFSVPVLLKYFSIENMDLVVLELVNQFFEELNEREQLIAKSRIFNIDTQLTLEQIGGRFGTTRERVRQIEAGLYKKLKRIFSKAILFFKQTIERCAIQNIDPCRAIKISLPFFKNRDSFINFLERIGIAQSKLDDFKQVEDLPSTGQIRNDILLNYKMPISQLTLESILMRDYGLNRIQMQNFLEDELSDSILRKDGLLFLEAGTKNYAVANVSLDFPNGIPWLDLAQISKAIYKKCENIRTTPGPDCSITDNPYLYNYGRGMYRNIKFYDVSAKEESEIEENVFEYVNSMKEEIKPLQAIKDHLKIQIHLHDLLHLLKDRSSRFNFDTKSGKILVIKGERQNALGYRVNETVIEFFKLKGKPLTTFEIKDCLNSKSEGNASLVVSLLIEEGEVIRFDGARYALVSSLDQEILCIVKKEIKLLLESSEKIVTGAFFKEIIESKSGFRFTRFFYSSVAQIVCKESSFYWHRHLCSKNEIERGFTIGSFARGNPSFSTETSFEEFRVKIKEKFEIDEALLRDEFNRFRSNLRVNKAAA